MYSYLAMSFNQLLFFQIIAHLSIVPMLLMANTSQFIYSIIVYFLTGCLGMSMTYHRLLAHKSWDAPNIFEYFGTLLSTIGLTGSSIAWIAIHREHHSHTDRTSDPHSPNQSNLFYVQFLSMLALPKLKYAVDLIRDPFHRFVHQYYFIINLIYGCLLYILVEPFAVIYLWLFPACILWNAGSLINTVCHRFGYRNFNTSDQSKNNLLLGYLMWGEGWHNNHHKFPSRQTFKVKWFELDISGILIKCILFFNKKVRAIEKQSTNGI